MNKRKTFTREFKLQAVQMMEQSGRPPADIARELGIRRNQLYKWRETLLKKGEASFPGSGRKRDFEQENAQLKRELEQVKEERDILKKAAAYFAKELE